ncbi:hypothetical protein Q3G72_007109 [Acer saccharum]|nr:hypothetical protein Q3G72_007109 [Acer saccharum]
MELDLDLFHNSSDADNDDSNPVPHRALDEILNDSVLEEQIGRSKAGGGAVVSKLLTSVLKHLVFCLLNLSDNTLRSSTMSPVIKNA